ncbi:MAG: DUF3147 domain-containing protein [archaeon]|nr:DUF3147 domain-containing protein [archaeon]MCP8314390.1 DUF3147 domain-containing protein [archaeon]MCP8318168.1 DUF3147 domain-containing protein [archaeon]MCP8321525.1 DUF3147 domain-containing protein [archaeon]
MRDKKLHANLLLLYFIIGGIVVSSTVFIGSEGKGLLAAFLALFPSVTFTTFLIIYLESGLNATLSYAKGLALLTPAWILYLLVFIFFLPKIEFYKAIALGISLYILSSFIIMRLVD